MPPFIPGLKLSEMFFHEAVQPLLQEHFPNLTYSAGRLDQGSDVLGFDTPLSRDHHWGPRLMLFLSEQDSQQSRLISSMLSERLPLEFHGYPTHFVKLNTNDAIMQPITAGPVDHYVQITTPERFFLEYTGVSLQRELMAVDWLLIPQQRLCTITSGKVFYDGLESLETVRRTLGWYPHDVWLYLLAAQWRRIDQEEPFMGRCADVGDDPGSRLIAARLVHEIMSLCFLMEKRYAPYSKWFGTAYARLRCAAELLPVLLQALQAVDWQAREMHLSQAYSIVGRMNNELRITPALEIDISRFHNRPYLVPHSDRYVQALLAQIGSQEVRDLPLHLGGIDQVVSNIDVLESIEHVQRLRVLYNR